MYDGLHTPFESRAEYHLTSTQLLADRLSLLGGPITDAELTRSIARYNALREQLWRMTALRHAVPFFLSGAGATELYTAAQRLPLEVFESALAARLEEAAGRPVDLVLLDEAPPALAYRIFRDGQAIAVRDPSALAARKARAILEYLDFQPIEELCARGALAAASRGR